MKIIRVDFSADRSAQIVFRLKKFYRTAIIAKVIIYSKRYADDTARRIYDQTLSSFASRFREAWQDSMISLKTAQDAILRQRGESIADFEDAYAFENRMHGMSRNRAKYFDSNVYKPLIKSVARLCKAAGMQFYLVLYSCHKNVAWTAEDDKKNRLTRLCVKRLCRC